ncbi:Excisionase domain-containing protein (fragment) [Stutzerimonas xanthomarina]
MTTNNVDSTLVPNEKEVATAAESHVQLAGVLSTEKQMQRFEIWDDGQRQHTVQLPTLALRLLDRVLAELAMGNAVRDGLK